MCDHARCGPAGAAAIVRGNLINLAKEEGAESALALAKEWQDALDGIDAASDGHTTDITKQLRQLLAPAVMRIMLGR